MPAHIWMPRTLQKTCQTAQPPKQPLFTHTVVIERIGTRTLHVSLNANITINATVTRKWREEERKKESDNNNLNTNHTWMSTTQNQPQSCAAPSAAISYGGLLASKGTKLNLHSLNQFLGIVTRNKAIRRECIDKSFNYPRVFSNDPLLN
jgi:hypothetical protein